MNFAYVLKMVEIYCVYNRRREGIRDQVQVVGAVDDTGRDDRWGPCMNGVLGKENDMHFLYSLV